MHIFTYSTQICPFYCWQNHGKSPFKTSDAGVLQHALHVCYNMFTIYFSMCLTCFTTKVIIPTFDGLSFSLLKVAIWRHHLRTRSTGHQQPPPGHLGPMWMSLCRRHALFTWQLVERIPALRLNQWWTGPLKPVLSGLVHKIYGKTSSYMEISWRYSIW